MNQQLDIFDAVLETYSELSEPISNKTLYQKVAEKLNLDENTINQTTNGKNGERYKIFFRACRWVQQSLKAKKLITNVSRGMWTKTSQKNNELTEITPEHNVIAASTELGLVIWTQNRKVFSADILDEDFHAIITSPPYPLKESRAYGNPAVSEYIDFICDALEPVLHRMARGGSILLNLSNDIFMSKSPARSSYYHRLVIALEDRLGLSLMDSLPWVSNKAPGPVLYASKTRQQLNYSYEHCLWMTNDPIKCFANNNRVLQPHTDQHLQLINSGGHKKTSSSSDGAYYKRKGAFSNPTNGRIAKNVLNISNYCHEGRLVTNFAREHSITPHGAKMPMALCDFFVQFLTRPGDLVIDLFGGTLTLGASAQKHGRRFIILEKILEYIVQGFHRFRENTDTWINPKLFHPHTNIAKPC